MRLDFDMNRFERYLFPRGELLNFFIIVCLSGAISFLLTGRQIYQANWGLIDDHEVFTFLGPRLHLPLGDIWDTLLGKTEVGTLQGRFRPSYYFLRVTETSLWGANVHLWYLGHTIGFAIFLSSIWWFLRRFVGGWLSGALTAYISLLPLWADVWSRLGPSEIYGATCVGLMVYAAYFTLFSDAPRARIASAIALTLATVALVGLKETFIPLAGGTAAVFLLAFLRKNLSPLVIGLLALVVLGCLGGIVFVVKNRFPRERISTRMRSEFGRCSGLASRDFSPRLHERGGFTLFQSCFLQYWMSSRASRSEAGYRIPPRRSVHMVLSLRAMPRSARSIARDFHSMSAMIFRQCFWFR
jgi:hypothetical protein